MNKNGVVIAAISAVAFTGALPAVAGADPIKSAVITIDSQGRTWVNGSDIAKNMAVKQKEDAMRNVMISNNGAGCICVRKPAVKSTTDNALA